MGRYSRQLAPLFADFAGVGAGTRVADVGAGTGALASELVARGATVAAADPSSAFVESLRTRLSGIEVHEAPAEELPWPDEQFDAALAQLVVSFMKDAPAGIREMRRIVRSGGTVAVCMWDSTGMEMLAAIRRARDVLGDTTDMADATYRTREGIESLFGDGFDGVETELLEVESSYSGFDEFWNALAGGAGPAGAWAAGLQGEGREAARDELRRQLGSPGGALSLRGRAWATRGRRA